MLFPLWKYLNQSLGNKVTPLIWNPYKFWLHYQEEHLARCLRSAFLEQCWQVNYSEFVTRHQAYCDRIPLEEDPVWLIERCWRLKRQSLYSYHPENS